MKKILMTGIEKAIEEAGGQFSLAEQLGVSQQVISAWKRKGWVPFNRITEISSQYGVLPINLINPKIIEFFVPTADHFLY